MDSQNAAKFTSWIRRHWGLLLGIALVIVGGLLAATAPSAPPKFGWFAYQPKADSVLLPTRWPEPQLVAGLCILGVGILTLTAVIGYRIGRRSRR